MSDIYKEGAAIANGASAAIADLISDKAGERFKKAFFETLFSFLYDAEGDTLAGVTEMVRISADGGSVDDLKNAFERGTKTRVM